jgi:pantoate--beta-alanine ligase
VIAEMVAELAFPVRVVDRATVREEDGLALSSRNRYLTPPQRERARALKRALDRGVAALEAGERAPAAVAEIMAAELAVTDGAEYAEVRRVPDLEVPARAEGHLVLAVAARVGRARLIDNLVVVVDRDRIRTATLLDEETA